MRAKSQPPPHADVSCHALPPNRAQRRTGRAGSRLPPRAFPLPGREHPASAHSEARAGASPACRTRDGYATLGDSTQRAVCGSAGHCGAYHARATSVLRPHGGNKSSRNLRAQKARGQHGLHVSAARLMPVCQAALVCMRLLDAALPSLSLGNRFPLRQCAQ